MTVEIVGSMKSSAMGALERLAPRLVWRRRVVTWNLNTNEPEQELLPWVCDPAKASVDIGAADGAYAARLLLYSARVLAFEPRPEAAAKLSRLFRNTSILQVEQVALSDESGEVALRSPLDRPMLSTIENANHLAESNSASVATVVVRKRCLDEYELGPVGFIKIDVEGHELGVVSGARRTLERERPSLLIEIEHRHNPASFPSITALLSRLGYAGFFLIGGKLSGIDAFSVEAHQEPGNIASGKRTGVYVNNFLFLPQERISSIPPELEPPKSTK